MNEVCVGEKKKSAIFGNLWVKRMSNSKAASLKKKKKKSYSSFPYTLMTPTHLLPSLAFLPSESAR